MRHRLAGTVITLTLMMLAFAPVTVRAGGDSGEREVYQATAMNLMGSLAGRGVGVTFSITSYRTDEEKLALANALAEGGSEGLMKALKKFDSGFVNVTGQTGWKLNCVWKSPTEDGGYRIAGILERQTRLGEHYANTRSLDYDFTVFEFFVDAKGKGKGQLIPAAKITFSKSNTVSVESFGAQPALLMGVSRRK
jgi:hypothetical protein